MSDLFKSMRIHKPPLERQITCAKHGPVTVYCHLNDMWSKCKQCAQESADAEAAQELQRKEAEALRNWQLSIDGAGIPERFRDRRFSNFHAETPEQQQALAIVKQYAQDWPDVAKSGKCLILSGSPGTGKTHLACAAGMTIMHKYHASVMFVTVQQAIRRVRDTWVKGSDKSESQALGEMVAPRLLILDEVGVQLGTEFERNVLFEVLNERYLKQRPTIMLTNLQSDEVAQYVGERVIDRLREDGCQVVPFSWESHRGKN